MIQLTLVMGVIITIILGESITYAQNGEEFKQGETPRLPVYNPEFDLKADGTIDLFDLVTEAQKQKPLSDRSQKLDQIAKHFGASAVVNGRALSDWVSDIRNGDHQTRQSAVVRLLHASNAEEVAEVVVGAMEGIVRDPNTTFDAKESAIGILRSQPDYNKVALPAAHAIVYDQNLDVLVRAVAVQIVDFADSKERIQWYFSTLDWFFGAERSQDRDRLVSLIVGKILSDDSVRAVAGGFSFTKASDIGLMGIGKTVNDGEIIFKINLPEEIRAELVKRHITFEVIVRNQTGETLIQQGGYNFSPNEEYRFSHPQAKSDYGTWVSLRFFVPQ